MSLGGSIFGEAKDGPDKQSRDAQARQSEAAGYTFNQTAPVLSALSSRYTDFLKNGMDVTKTPQYNALTQALKDNTEQQYGNAKNQILETVQQGGALTNALTGLERGRASTLTQGNSGIVNDLTNQELSRAFAFGTGQAPVALGGLGSAANTAAYNSANASQNQSAAMRGFGNAIGSYLGRNNSGNTGSKNSGGNSEYGTATYPGAGTAETGW